MRNRLRAVTVGAAALAVAASVALWGGAAFAVTPGFEPDPDALGSLTFYNSSGQAITSGSLTAVPFVAFAAASGPPSVAGHNRAFLAAATPKANVPTFQFDSAQMTLASNFPNASAPPPINTFTNPVATGQAGTSSLADYISGHQNTETAPNLANIYEIRLFTSAIGSPVSGQYYRTDVQVDPAAGTWTVVFPTATQTTTTLTASPQDHQQVGMPVALTAHVAPLNTPGSVHFFDGATDLGAGTYDPASGDATLSVSTLAVGPHQLTATFSPTDPTAFSSSTSTPLTYTIDQPAGVVTHVSTPTAIPPSGTVAGTSHTLDVTFSATVTADTQGTDLSGTVSFSDGNTVLGNGTYNAATGVATFPATLSEGTHPISAEFHPSATGVSGSTSNALQYFVAPNTTGTAGHADVTLNAQNNTEPFVGALTLTVANTSVDLTQNLPITDPANHPVDATDPSGHKHAWVFSGNLTGVSVNDTRTSPAGWTVNGVATNFVNGTTTISSANLGWTPALGGGDATGVTAGSGVDSMLKTASSSGLSTSKVLATAPAGQGVGTANLSTGLELRIPDTSPTGTYTSTLTLTLVSP